MIPRRRTMLALGVFLAGYGLGIAQAGPRPTDAVGSAPLVLAGLATEWSAAFARRGGRVRLTRPFGPPQGALDPNLGAFLDGRLDFAFLTREIVEADLARFRSRHRGEDPVIVPVAGGSWRRFGYVDAVVVIEQPGAQPELPPDRRHLLSIALARRPGSPGVGRSRARGRLA